jgi:hypothetical protein
MRNAAINSSGRSAAARFAVPSTKPSSALHDAVRFTGAQSGQFLDGARVVVEAMLQSPKFLFHVEARRADALPNGERAEAGITPSPAGSRICCGTRCRTSGCSTPRPAANCDPATVLTRVVKTMLDQPAARQAVDEFFAQWLRFDRALGSVKDRRRYPEFTPELAAMMVQETALLLGNPRVERRQLHGSVHRRLQFPECGSGERLRRAGAVR